MKPISSLKAFRSGTTATGIIAAFLSVISNPKRHLRGPFLGTKPGSGKIQCDIENGNGKTSDAVCGCASGILGLVAARGSALHNIEARTALDTAAVRLYPDSFGFVSVSDGIGLRAIRKVAKAALADLRGG